MVCATRPTQHDTFLDAHLHWSEQSPPRLRGRRVLRRVRLLRVVRRLGARSGPCAADVRCCSSDDGQPHRRSYGGGASVSAYRAGFCSDSQRRPTAALVALLPATTTYLTFMENHNSSAGMPLSRLTRCSGSSTRRPLCSEHCSISKTEIGTRCRCSF